MSDLDRYLTDELVGRAARAIYESERMATPWRDASGEDRGWFAGQSRAALSAALPDIIQQAKAEALRDAADQRLSRAAFAVDSKHHFHAREDGTPVCSCGFEGDARKRTQTEHITGAVIEEYRRG